MRELRWSHSTMGRQGRTSQGGDGSAAADPTPPAAAAAADYPALPKLKSGVTLGDEDLGGLDTHPLTPPGAEPGVFSRSSQGAASKAAVEVAGLNGADAGQRRVADIQAAEGGRLAGEKQVENADAEAEAVAVAAAAAAGEAAAAADAAAAAEAGEETGAEAEGEAAPAEEAAASWGAAAEAEGETRAESVETDAEEEGESEGAADVAGEMRMPPPSPPRIRSRVSWNADIDDAEEAERTLAKPHGKA